MVDLWITIPVLFVFIHVVFGLGEDVCYHERRGQSYECEWGCCGTTGEKECCDHLSMIIGISIGCVIVVAAIIAIIVCCVKHQTRSRRRLTPRQSGQIMMVSQAKGPPAYPGEPFQTYPAYTDSYKGPLVEPPPTYHQNQAYAPPSYIPPNQQVLYGGSSQLHDKLPTNAPQSDPPSDKSPPPPYTI